MARAYDLVAFDVDGTLVEAPDGRIVWEILHERFGTGADDNAANFHEYVAGRLSYADWVAKDIGGWREAGARREELVEAMRTLRLVDGARETLSALAADGCRLIVISGTLDLLLATVWPDHPFDEIYANHIGFDDDGRIAHWRATPFDMEGKASALRAVAMREGLPLTRCAFVGDSVNDTWIARAAGFSVAFNPKCEEFERAASVVVRSSDLRDILPHLCPREA
jgi:phosphoserine phosphatase